MVSVIAVVSLAITFGPRISPPEDRPIKKALQTQPGLIGGEMRTFSARTSHQNDALAL